MDQQDVKYMDIAIEQAAQDPRFMKVGAVVVKDGQEMGKGYGAQFDRDEHAEYTVLERWLMNRDDVKGATLYTTLEPCTRSYHPTNPRKTCAQIIASRGVRRVVIGLPDPNPDITGNGERLLKREGITVEVAPDEWQRRIEALMKGWVDAQRKIASTNYDALFAELEKERSPEFADFSGFAVGDIITLRLCPDIMNGWLSASVELVHDTTRFRLPHEYRQPYAEYFKEHYEEKGLKTDNPKIMLVRNPRSFIDSPTLTLHTRETLYSHTLFYNYVVAADSPQKAPLIRELYRRRRAGRSLLKHTVPSPYCDNRGWEGPHD